MNVMPKDLKAGKRIIDLSHSLIHSSILLELGKGSQLVVTIPYLFLKESDNVTAFRIRGKNVNVL